MSLGWQEILLVMIFALVIFGPRRLPDIARQIGKAIREVRRVSSEFEREVKTSFALDEHHSSYVVPDTPSNGDEPKAPDAPPVADDRPADPPA